MKKNWVRGVLLGLSMALLLSGGVALAQELFLQREKPCVVCVAGEAHPSEDQLQRLTLGGWTTRYPLCLRAMVDGQMLVDFCFLDYPPTDPYTPAEGESFPCEWGNEQMGLSALGEEVNVSNGPPSPLGVWKYVLYQDIPGRPNPRAVASWLVARVCEEEFVPEPGSILLLGSGLAGLAGYATLRWRTRE